MTAPVLPINCRKGDPIFSKDDQYFTIQQCDDVVVALRYTLYWRENGFSAINVTRTTANITIPSEPYSQALVKGLILVFFFIAASVSGTPWKQIRQAWSSASL
ncbi:hypothetical protein cypCar_00019884 [Cyprinus carpio]|nr:hypothetical protein cypCar_00019884 [Cyprinus carpio]